MEVNLRLLVLFFLPFLLLYAKEMQTCYSIALLSAQKTSQNKLKLLKRYGDSKTCKILEIGKMFSVRCGCYAAFAEARMQLENLQADDAKYKTALITSTYRYRFEEKQKPLEKKVPLPKTVPIKTIVVHQSIKKVEKKKVQKKEKIVPVVFESIGESSQSDSQPVIDATILGRYVSNKKVYKGAPYFFALIESQYEKDDFSIEGGVAFESIQKNEELLINSLVLRKFTQHYTFNIGKMVQKVGVLDYFSLLDIVNPSRSEFFYDTKLTIKKVPLWMSSVDYYINDEITLTLFVQPYDTKHASYQNVYVNYMLNQFIPAYYKNVFKQEPLGRDVFYPLYANTLVPYLTEDIHNKSLGSKIYLDKLSYGAIAQYSNDSMKLGATYFNKYSEIPLIRVDQNLLDAAIAYDNGKNPSEELVYYVESGDYEPIKSVHEFRYQQYGLYGESTYKSFGLRAELAYRDKIPLFNNYSALYAAGFGVDKFTDLVYNALETQYLYLQRYHKSAYISMLRSRFRPTTFYKVSGYFENSFILSKIDSSEEYSIAPRYVITYKGFDLAIEGLFSKNNKDTNTLSLLLRGQF